MPRKYDYFGKRNDKGKVAVLMRADAAGGEMWRAWPPAGWFPYDVMGCVFGEDNDPDYGPIPEADARRDKPEAFAAENALA